MKMIESSKKKIAPEIHLMTRQKEQIYLVCTVDIGYSVSLRTGKKLTL